MDIVSLVHSMHKQVTKCQPEAGCISSSSYMSLLEKLQLLYEAWIFYLEKYLLDC